MTDSLNVEPQWAGVVLCGGKSRRFGTDKAQALFQGVSLLSIAVSTLQGCVETVYLSTGRGQETYDPDLIHIQDEMEQAGPLSGIASVFAATKAERLIVLATDLPRVTSEDIRLLVRAHQSPLTLSRDRLSGREQPLCGLWDRSLHAPLEAYLSSGRRSVLGFVDEHEAHWVDLPSGHLVNINAKEDLG